MSLFNIYIMLSGSMSVIILKCCTHGYNYKLCNATNTLVISEWSFFHFYTGHSSADLGLDWWHWHSRSWTWRRVYLDVDDGSDLTERRPSNDCSALKCSRICVLVEDHKWWPSWWPSVLLFSVQVGGDSTNHDPGYNIIGREPKVLRLQWRGMLLMMPSVCHILSWCLWSFPPYPISQKRKNYYFVLLYFLKLQDVELCMQNIILFSG